MYYDLINILKRAEITLLELSQKIDISYVSLYHKIKGRFDWKIKEMLLIQSIVNQKLNTNYTLDELFKRG